MKQTAGDLLFVFFKPRRISNTGTVCTNKAQNFQMNPARLGRAMKVIKPKAPVDAIIASKSGVNTSQQDHTALGSLEKGSCMCSFLEDGRAMFRRGN